MRPLDSEDFLFWDIVKGLGILCIVIGHTCATVFNYAYRFVYLFHLAVFFFVSGFLYSESKYGDYPSLNFAARMRSNWPRYMAYMLFFVLCHNIYMRFGIINNTVEYSYAHFMVAIANSVIFASNETMGAALWFIPILIVSSGLFGVIIYLGRRVKKIVGTELSKIITVIILTVLVGRIGVYTNLHNLNLTNHIQTAFLVVPLFTAAWAVRSYVKNWMKMLHWLLGIVLFVILCYGMVMHNWMIELSINHITGPIEFYCISLAGVYLCLTVAKYLLYVPWVRTFFSFIGRYSFDIMAGHFLVIKIIDVIYAKIIGEMDPMVYGEFPHAYSTDLWWLYVVAATVCPALVAALWSKIKAVCAKRICFKR